MKNRQFINSPITTIFEEAIMSTDCLKGKMGMYPIVEYIFHSLFLKISGAMEQKVHAIVLEMARHNNDVSRELVGGNFKNNSALEDKEKIFKELAKQIILLSEENITIDLQIYWSSSVSRICSLFETSAFKPCMSQEFTNFIKIAQSIQLPKTTICLSVKGSADKGIFSDAVKLKNIYDKHLYKTRNSLAHNSMVGKLNLPTIRILSSQDYEFNNFFLFFAIFTFMDNIFINEFKQYMELLELY